jgi:MFS family permease
MRRGLRATPSAESPHYKWVALSNTTLGMLMATINSSIVLIALPAIFNGLHVDPLTPQNTSLLLWVLLGYMVVTSTLLVTVGRISDMLGRVKMYRAGFAVFAIGSILLFLTPSTGTTGAIELILFRVVQAVGGSFIFANSSAILTDAFPPLERGFALGLNQVAAVAGSVAGLILGGILATVDWRLVFLVSVPFAVIGAIWAYIALHETASIKQHQKLDPWGNITFGVGLTILLVGLTYGILPYGGQAMGWTNPWVIAAIAGGVALLVVFAIIEVRVPDPMFKLELFGIRAFAAGNLAAWLGATARGGLQFMLIIWLQGIWLPIHGYAFSQTPLWAGIYMLPMMIGFLLAGPLSGRLSDRYDPRIFSTGGMVVTMIAFILLSRLPASFAYLPFGGLLLLIGIGMGLFASPNTSSVMSSVPAENRGVASGMLATLQNSGMLFSMAIFFTVLIVGLSAHLRSALFIGLKQAGLPAHNATAISHLPPTAALFSSFLGYNPMAHLVPPRVLGQLSTAAHAHLLSRGFFPSLIAPPFMDGLSIAFYISAGMAAIAAVASLLRGPRFIHGMNSVEAPAAPGAENDELTPMAAASGSGGVSP